MEIMKINQVFVHKYILHLKKISKTYIFTKRFMSIIFLKKQPIRNQKHTKYENIFNIWANINQLVNQVGKLTEFIKNGIFLKTIIFHGNNQYISNLPLTVSWNRHISVIFFSRKRPRKIQ